MLGGRWAIVRHVGINIEATLVNHPVGAVDTGLTLKLFCFGDYLKRGTF